MCESFVILYSKQGFAPRLSVHRKNSRCQTYPMMDREPLRVQRSERIHNGAALDASNRRAVINTISIPVGTPNFGYWNRYWLTPSVFLYTLMECNI